jgi:nucleotide-binding universal stress UspA family protein
MSHYQHVMVAIDGSDESARIVERGVAFAKRRKNQRHPSVRFTRSLSDFSIK